MPIDDAQRTVQRVENAANSESMSAAFTELSRDYDQYSRNHSSEETRAYWNNVTRGLQNQNLLPDLAFEWGKRNEQQLSGENGITRDSLAQASRNMQLDNMGRTMLDTVRSNYDQFRNSIERGNERPDRHSMNMNNLEDRLAASDPARGRRPIDPEMYSAEAANAYDQRRADDRQRQMEEEITPSRSRPREAPRQSWEGRPAHELSHDRFSDPRPVQLGRMHENFGRALERAGVDPNMAMSRRQWEEFVKSGMNSQDRGTAMAFRNLRDELNIVNQNEELELARRAREARQQRTGPTTQPRRRE